MQEERRMRKGKNIGPETMAKVWKAHKSGMTNDLIAAMLDISYQSVIRVISIKSTAEVNPAALDNLYPDQYHAQKRATKEYFAPPATPKEETKTDNTGHYLLEVFKTLREINENITALREAWK